MKTKNWLLWIIVSFAFYAYAPSQTKAAPRPPMWPPLPELARATYTETFDELYHAGVSNAVVELPTLGTLRESWSGYSLERAGAVTPLVIAGLGETGQAQVATGQGSLRFWFSPHWSSGSGPGRAVPLVELVAVAGPKSAALWSLQVSADGRALRWVGPEEKELLVAAKIDWAAGSWHQVILNYGTNGTELLLDGEVVARGAATLSVPAEVTRLVIGSTLAGELSADGEFDEVYCFARPLRLAFHYLALRDITVLGPVSEEEMAFKAELRAKWAAMRAMKGPAVREAGSGMQRLLSGPAAECITNSPLYITNVISVWVTNQGWTVTFDVQGTNGPADIFSTTNFSGPSLTAANWTWLERGPSCSTYQYTNQPTGQTFYLLGTSLDSDGDGLTDAYERLVSKTLVSTNDTDADGLPDKWEMDNQLNPLDPADAGDDPDGDWLSNLQEYHGGTNSTNPHDLMVVAWGDDTHGQGEVPENLRAVAVVGAGFGFSLARRQNGTVVAWGDNLYGQTNVPVTFTNCAAFSAGTHHTLALRADSTATVWGDWWTQDGYSAANFPGNWTNLIAVAAGADHDVALLANGNVWTWSYYVSNSAPYTQVPLGLPAAKAVAAGWDHSVALLTNGTVRAWGLNYSSFGWNVTNVPAGLSNVVAIAAGAWHTLALRNNGTVAAWGAGTVNDPDNSILGADFGQSIVPEGLSNVVAIAAGGYHSLALRADGSVVGWGDLPTPDFLQSNVVAIAAGVTHNLAVRSGRQLPLILKSPLGRPELPGANVTYTALGLGLAGVHYQWQFNGVNLTNQTNAALTVTNINTANQGGYSVVIATGAGAITSSVATLTLIGPPLITNTTPTAPSTNWFTNGVSAPIYFTVQATALETQRYPLQYQWYTNGVAIVGATNQNYYQPLPWVPLWQTNPANANYSVQVWNPVGTNAAGPWTMRVISLPKPGSTVAWGDNSDGQAQYPVDLTNTLAVSAGQYHSVAVREDGGLAYWGYAWATLPNDLTNLVSASAGYAHTLVLRRDGSVTAWGQAGADANTVPANNYGLRSISAGRYHNLAVRTNGNILAWGLNLPGVWNLTDVPVGVTNVTAVAAGAYHSLALKADGTVISWGYNGSGQTNVPSGLSNVVAIAAGERFSLALKENGSISAWGDNSENQCSVPAGLSNVMALAAGRAHGVALKNDGTVVCWGDNSAGQTNVPSLLNNVKLIAAGGDHTLAGVFSPLVQYPVDVTKDLLLIYNTNSTNSIWVKDYYLAHRPMVGGANELGVSCATNELISNADFTNQVQTPYLNWLKDNPTKRPQYLIWFLDLPGRVGDGVTPFPSPSYRLHTAAPGIPPFVTCINQRTTNDCKAYIDKLEFFGTNYSPGKFFISASAGGYENTNYIVDNVRAFEYAEFGSTVFAATNGLLAAGILPNAILYSGTNQPCLSFNTNGDCTSQLQLPQHQLTNATDVAGYISWGAHSTWLGGFYAVDGKVKWTGNSRWWIIETVESFNGSRQWPQMGHFSQWFSADAFGGTNYMNTPVGAVTHVEEPTLFGVNKADLYFGLWASGKCFGSAAWNSRNTAFFQAVGDPFVTK